MKLQASLCMAAWWLLGTMQLANSSAKLINFGLENALRSEIQAVENEMFQEEDGVFFSPAGRRGIHSLQATCNPPCLNGRCTGPMRCKCTGGWRGNRCEIPVCRYSCLNGGKCVGPNYCQCKGQWTGAQCHLRY